MVTVSGGQGRGLDKDGCRSVDVRVPGSRSKPPMQQAVDGGNGDARQRDDEGTTDGLADDRLNKYSSCSESG
jgi:hypothetical protein